MVIKTTKPKNSNNKKKINEKNQYFFGRIQDIKKR